ncbi:MAG: c-type cytochrome [Bacteroidota bacterium]
MSKEGNENVVKQLIIAAHRLIITTCILIFGCLSMFIVVFFFYNQLRARNNISVDTPSEVNETAFWKAADINSITNARQKEMVQYGRELIAHTSRYFGPKGSVLQITNGLNCQNCHLQAGTAVFGNNYGSVASLYPKFRVRSGTAENVYKRVNDCFERSLNGKAIDTLGKEMQAIAAYINFIGSNVVKGKKAIGSGFKDIPYLNRAADVEKGKVVYHNKCQSCHQPDGRGQLNPEGNEFVYPALWNSGSYNDGAGLFRISNLAKYVKYNMPQGVTFQNPKLTDEEAWDVAAYINTQMRPHKDTSLDWPDVTTKPIDHPVGPYADIFSETQHKYGPFKPIADVPKK